MAEVNALLAERPARPVTPIIKLLSIGVLECEVEIVEFGQKITQEQGRYNLSPHGEINMRLIFRNLGSAPISVSGAKFVFLQCQEASFSTVLNLNIMPTSTSDKTIPANLASLLDGNNDLEIFFIHSPAARPEVIWEQVVEHRIKISLNIRPEPCLVINQGQFDEATVNEFIVEKYKPCKEDGHELISFMLFNSGRNPLSINECSSTENWLVPKTPKRRIGGGKSRLLKMFVKPQLLGWGENRAEVHLKTNSAVKAFRFLNFRVQGTSFGPILDLDKTISAGRILAGGQSTIRFLARNLGVGELTVNFTSQDGSLIRPSTISIPGRKADAMKPPEREVEAILDTYTLLCKDEQNPGKSVNTPGWHIEMQTNVKASSNSYLSEYATREANIKYKLYHGYSVPSELYFPFAMRPSRATAPVEIKATDGGIMAKQFFVAVEGPMRWWRMPLRISAKLHNQFEVTFSIGRFRPWRPGGYSLSFYRPSNKMPNITVPLTWAPELPRRKLRESPVMWICAVVLSVFMLLWIMSR